MGTVKSSARPGLRNCGSTICCRPPAICPSKSSTRPRTCSTTIRFVPSRPRPPRLLRRPPAPAPRCSPANLRLRRPVLPILPMAALTRHPTPALTPYPSPALTRHPSPAPIQAAEAAFRLRLVRRRSPVRRCGIDCSEVPGNPPGTSRFTGPRPGNATTGPRPGNATPAQPPESVLAIKLLALEARLAGNQDPQVAEDVFVHRT